MADYYSKPMAATFNWLGRLAEAGEPEYQQPDYRAADAAYARSAPSVQEMQIAEQQQQEEIFMQQYAVRQAQQMASTYRMMSDGLPTRDYYGRGALVDELLTESSPLTAKDPLERDARTYMISTGPVKQIRQGLRQSVEKPWITMTPLDERLQPIAVEDDTGLVRPSVKAQMQPVSQMDIYMGAKAGDEQSARFALKHTPASKRYERALSWGMYWDDEDGVLISDKREARQRKMVDDQAMLVAEKTGMSFHAAKEKLFQERQFDEQRRVQLDALNKEFGGRLSEAQLMEVQRRRAQVEILEGEQRFIRDRVESMLPVIEEKFGDSVTPDTVDMIAQMAFGANSPAVDSMNTAYELRRTSKDGSREKRYADARLRMMEAQEALTDFQAGERDDQFYYTALNENASTRGLFGMELRQRVKADYNTIDEGSLNPIEAGRRASMMKRKKRMATIMSGNGSREKFAEVLDRRGYHKLEPAAFGYYTVDSQAAGAYEGAYSGTIEVEPKRRTKLLMDAYKQYQSDLKTGKLKYSNRDEKDLDRTVVEALLVRGAGELIDELDFEDESTEAQNIRESAQEVINSVLGQEHYLGADQAGNVLYVGVDIDARTEAVEKLRTQYKEAAKEIKELIAGGFRPKGQQDQEKLMRQVVGSVERLARSGNVDVNAAMNIIARAADSAGLGENEQLAATSLTTPKAQSLRYRGGDKPVPFNTKEEAREAYRLGKINKGDKVYIKEIDQVLPIVGG